MNAQYINSRQWTLNVQHTQQHIAVTIVSTLFVFLKKRRSLQSTPNVTYGLTTMSPQQPRRANLSPSWHHQRPITSKLTADLCDIKVIFRLHTRDKFRAGHSVTQGSMWCSYILSHTVQCGAVTFCHTRSNVVQLHSVMVQLHSVTHSSMWCSYILSWCSYILSYKVQCGAVTFCHTRCNVVQLHSVMVQLHSVMVQLHSVIQGAMWCSYILSHTVQCGAVTFSHGAVTFCHGAVTFCNTHSSMP